MKWIIIIIFAGIIRPLLKAIENYLSPPIDIDPDKELQKGIKYEMEEHGISEVEAEKIARKKLEQDSAHYFHLKNG